MYKQCLFKMRLKYGRWMPLVSRIFRRIISVDIAEVWCRPNCVRKTGRRPTNRTRSFVGQTQPMAACWRWILSTFFVSCCRLAACQYITLSISSLDSLFFFFTEFGSSFLSPDHSARATHTNQQSNWPHAHLRMRCQCTHTVRSKRNIYIRSRVD